MAASVLLCESSHLTMIFSRQVNTRARHSDNLLCLVSICGIGENVLRAQPRLEPGPYGLWLPARTRHPLQEGLLLRIKIPLHIQLLVFRVHEMEGAGELHPGLEPSLKYRWAGYVNLGQTGQN